MSVKRCQILLLTIIYLTSVQSQIWAGKFQIDSTCPTNTCCCPSDIVSIIPLSEDQLSINFTVVGILCFGINEFELDNITTPTGYNFTGGYSAQRYGFTLNNDSNSLTISSALSSQCTVNSTRIFEAATHMLNTSTSFYQWNRLQKSLIVSFLFIFIFTV